MDSVQTPEKIPLSADQDSTTATVGVDIQTADELFQEGRYPQALDLYKKILDSGLESNQFSPEDLIRLYKKLGKASIKYDCYPEANEYYTKALEIKKVNFSDDIYGIASMNVDIGEVLFAQGKASEALDIFLPSMEMLLRDSQINQDKIAYCHLNLSRLYEEQAQYDKALISAEKAIKAYSQYAIFGPKFVDMYGPELVNSYNAMTAIKTSLGEFDQALVYATKALETALSVYGQKHPDMGKCYKILGNVWGTQGKYKNALENYKKALEIILEFFGESHLSLSGCYNNIGIVHSEEHSFDEALENYHKSLKIDITYYGSDHPRAASSYFNIAGVYSDQMDYAKALDYYYRALSIQVKCFGENHPDVAGTYNNLANVYQKQHKFSKAEEYIKKSLSINSKYFGKQHPEVANSYHILGTLYFKQNCYEKALPNFLHCLKIRRNFFDDDYYESAKCYYSIGFMLQSQGRYAEAEKYDKKYYKAFKMNFADDEEAIESSKKRQNYLDSMKSKFDSGHDFKI